MTVTPEIVAEEAMSWVGTPFVHQASKKQAGADCLGVVRGIWSTLFKDVPKLSFNYSSDWGDITDQDILRKSCQAHLKVVPQPTLGCILLFRMRHKAICKHLGVLVEGGGTAKFVHAYHRHGVVISPLNAPWRSRIAGCFVFPELGV